MCKYQDLLKIIGFSARFEMHHFNQSYFKITNYFK